MGETEALRAGVSNPNMTVLSQTAGVNAVSLSPVRDTVSLPYLPLLSLSTPPSH